MFQLTRLMAIGILSLALVGHAFADEAKSKPKKVDPPTTLGGAPADAIVLFDGSDVDQWSGAKGGEVKWAIEDGAMVARPGAGSIITKELFGDIQLHVEFNLPEEPEDEGQDRANSGIYVQARYEVQVLDSYGGETYPDGQCGAVYGQAPPLVNVTRPPGEWQTYDIIFRAARFDEDGKRTKPASFTVFHNGVMIHDHFRLEKGDTTASMWKEGPGDGPVYLQDHGSKVRYRNIWLRKLAPESEGK